VSYAGDILRDLEPLNEGRDKRDRITYDSLWVHAKRHYDRAGIAAYWTARMDKELKNALGDKGCRTYRIATGKWTNYEEFLARWDLQFETVWRAIEPAW
jgi:hypothetical protein